MKKRLLLLSIALISGIISYSQNITVNNNYTNNDLVNNVFLNGTCTEVSAIQVKGYTFQDGIKSWGYFNKGQSNFPFDEGIILTTGKLNAAPGPNSGTLSDGPSSWGGDIDLENSVNINNTYNATSLEFNFIPDANTMRFEYIFASEQYLLSGTPSQCGYTDGFAFILTDVTNNGTPQNLALVPNTTIPVTSSTIRGAGGLCPPANAQYFASYNNINSPIAYNGNTVPLMVEANVVPGHTYHIKIVIADQGNNLYDSAVFLRANSFDASISLGNDRLLSTFNALCAGETLSLNAAIPNAASYKWYRNNQLIAGATNATYNVTQAGVYKVEITKSNNCVTYGEITIEYDNFTYTSEVSLQVCGLTGTTTSFFNLNDAIPLITQNEYEEIFFYQSINNNIPSGVIANTTNYQAANNTTLYAIIQSENGCEYTVKVKLLINNENLPAHLYAKCDSDETQDGLTSFSLSAISQEILQQNSLNNQYQVTYYLTANDALSGQNGFTNTFNNTVPNQQTIYAQISLNGSCYAIIPVELTIFTSVLFPKKEIKLCKGDSVELRALGESTSYRWNTNEVTRTITVSEAGLYTVTYTTEDGCEVTEQFTIIVSAGPDAVRFDIQDFSATSNSITIHASGSGDYEYSLDGENFQSNASFTNLSPGVYTVYIRDKNGCGSYQEKVYLLDYPRFFSPNGDGRNDVWRIENLSWMDSKAIIRIFDRYGKLLYEFSAQYYWDGMHNNHPMPSTDYWFTITFSDKKVLKGHFSLVR